MLVIDSNFRDYRVIIGRSKYKYNQTFITCFQYDKCLITSLLNKLEGFMREDVTVLELQRKF